MNETADHHLLRIARLEYDIGEIDQDLIETACDPAIDDDAWGAAAAEQATLAAWRDAILKEIQP